MESRRFVSWVEAWELPVANLLSNSNYKSRGKTYNNEPSSPNSSDSLHKCTSRNFPITFTLCRSTGWKKVSHMLSFLFKMRWQISAHCSTQWAESGAPSLGTANREWMAALMELMALMDVTCCRSFPTPLRTSEAHLEKWVDRRVSGEQDGRTDRQTGRQTDGWMDGQTDGQADRRMDGQTVHLR